MGMPRHLSRLSGTCPWQPRNSLRDGTKMTVSESQIFIIAPGRDLASQAMFRESLRAHLVKHDGDLKRRLKLLTSMTSRRTSTPEGGLG